MLWIVFQVGASDQEAAEPELVRDSPEASGLAERLLDAVADTAAEQAVGVVFGTWSGTDEQQPYLEAVDFISGIPDLAKPSMEALSETILQQEATVHVAVFAGDVASAFVMQPIAKPIGDLIRIAEIVGVVLGMLTGLHGLAVVCMKRLIVSKVESYAATLVTEAVTVVTEPAAEAAQELKGISTALEEQTTETYTTSFVPQEPSDVLLELLHTDAPDDIGPFGHGSAVGPAL